MKRKWGTKIGWGFAAVSLLSGATALPSNGQTTSGSASGMSAPWRQAAEVYMGYVTPDSAARPVDSVSIGVFCAESTDALTSQLGLKPGEGLIVEGILSGSPAETAGLRTNDVMVQFDGETLIHPMQLRKLAQMHDAGDTGKLVFFRHGQKQSADVTLTKTNVSDSRYFGGSTSGGAYRSYIVNFSGTNGSWALPNGAALRSLELFNPNHAADQPAAETAWLGLSVSEPSDVLASQLNLKRGEGLVVGFVAPDSPAASAGFQTNDVLIKLNGQMLVAPEQYRKLISMQSIGDKAEIAFYRRGQQQTASVTLGKTTSAQYSDGTTGIGSAANLRQGLPLFQPGSPSSFVYVVKPNDTLNNISSKLRVSPDEILKANPSLQENGTNLKVGGKLIIPFGPSDSAANSDAARFKSVMQQLDEISHAVGDSVNRGTVRAQDLARVADERARQIVKQADKSAQDVKQYKDQLATLARNGINIAKDATIIVRNRNSGDKTILQTDEQGTLLVQSGAKNHLTARDPDGKILFDGEIATPEQQKNVPESVWSRAKPLVDELTTKPDSER